MSLKTNCFMVLCFAVLVLVGGGCKSRTVIKNNREFNVNSVFENNWTPIQLYSIGSRRLVDSKSEFPPTVFGGSFGIACNDIRSLYGIGFAPLMTKLSQYNVGVFTSLLFIDTKSALNAGIIFAPIQVARYILNAGILGGIINRYQLNYGLSFGLFNYGEVNYGLQIGLFNKIKINKGVSIGLINRSLRGDGVTGYQFGLYNECDNFITPIFMFSGGGDETPDINWSSEISAESDGIPGI